MLSLLMESIALDVNQQDNVRSSCALYRRNTYFPISYKAITTCLQNGVNILDSNIRRQIHYTNVTCYLVDTRASHVVLVKIVHS